VPSVGALLTKAVSVQVQIQTYRDESSRTLSNWEDTRCWRCRTARNRRTFEVELPVRNVFEAPTIVRFLQSASRA